MKVLFEDYSFNAASKQITFNTSETVSLERVLVITNVTRNIIIYNFADPTRGGTISNNVLTLTYDTTTMANEDKLQIFLESLSSPASEDVMILLRRIVQLLSPIATQDSAQRQRVVIDAGTLTTVTTVSNLASIAGVDPRFQFIDWARTAYNTGIRNNLTNL